MPNLRGGIPQTYADEQLLLPDEINQQENEQDAENEEYQRIKRNQFIDDELAGSNAGAGYARPPNAMGRGYAVAPNATGGWIVPLAMGLSSILPALLGRGKGKKWKGMRQPIYLSHSPNLTSTSGFYKSLIAQAQGQGLSMKTFAKLFGNKTLLNSILKGKMGSGVVDELKIGHVLSPLVFSHLSKALKGTGIDPEQLMEHAENLPMMNQSVNPKTMTVGGSILGSLWNMTKGVLGKLTGVAKNVASNPKVRELAKKGLDKAGEVMNNRIGDIGEIAANKIADYATKRMTGDEPDVEEDDEPNYTYLEKVRRRNAPQAPPMPSFQGQINAQKRNLNSQTQPKRQPQRRVHRDYEEDEFEQEPAVKTNTYRKKIVADRKAVVPAEESQERKVVGYRFGRPVYEGEGKKKKVRGGWVVKLR